MRHDPKDDEQTAVTEDVAAELQQDAPTAEPDEAVADEQAAASDDTMTPVTEVSSNPFHYGFHA